MSGLYGRDPELETLNELIDDARSGQGAALTVLGAAGMGRTTLVEAAVRLAGPDVLALGTTGVPSESGLPFSGLHRLLGPVADRIAALPGTYRAALAVIDEGGGGSPAGPGGATDALDSAGMFALGAAVHRLLIETAKERPLLCWADDLHLLDAVSRAALAFAARRVAAAPVLMLFTADRAAATPGTSQVPGDVPQMLLGPLDEAALLRVLADRLGTVRDEDTALELAVLSAGNPLALVELAGALTPAHLSGELPPPRSLPAQSRLRERHRERLEGLPAGARRLALLVAAAPGRLPHETLNRAAAIAGLDPAELAPAEAAGLVRAGAEAAETPGPLIADVIVSATDPAGLRAAHRLLSEAFGEQGDDLHRCLHLAAATERPGDDLAVALVKAAAAADRAGDFSGSAEAWERAARLCGDPETRAAHLMSAATAAWLAGRSGAVRLLLRQAGAGLRRAQGERSRGPARADSTGRIRALTGLSALLRGELELRTGQPAGARRLLLEAADDLLPTLRELGIGALMRAGEAACASGAHAEYLLIAERAAALRRPASPGAQQDPPTVRLMFDHFAGMSAVYQGRPGEAMESLRRVMERAETTGDCAAKIWGAMSGLFLGEDLRAHTLATEAAETARGSGAAVIAPSALEFVALAELWLGRYRAAMASSLEGLRLARATGQHNGGVDHLATMALLAAFQGDRQTVDVRLEALRRHAVERGLARPDRIGAWARACLDLAEDRPSDARGRLRNIMGLGFDHPAVLVMSVPHLVEASVLCGRRRGARRAFEVFDQWATSTQSPGRLALAERCRALLTEKDDVADEHFEAALRLHRTSGSAFELARTEFLYGGRLRRSRRPRIARDHLWNALHIFERYDAEPWAARARAELRAAGESVGPASAPVAEEELTPQQREIARLVAQGLTNKEVAARLFLSHRTIDHHLRNIFTRLGVRSRVELTRIFG